MMITREPVFRHRFYLDVEYPVIVSNQTYHVILISTTLFNNIKNDDNVQRFGKYLTSVL